MAASNAVIGYGDTLEWSTDDGATWNDVVELKSCTLPTGTIEKIERTHMASPGRTKEYAIGLRDINDVEFTFNFASATYEALFTLEKAGTVVQWRHSLARNDDETTGAVFEYDGAVELGGGERTVDGITEISGTVKVTAVHTFTAGS